ncbi:MAG TPA: SLC13/DASS family transporter [Gammaproteobacteria bacterium]|nr:SLC13/DASS family transporter [Gammaproteobacteria bacterium]
MLNIKHVARLLGPLLAIACPLFIDIPGHPQAAFMLGIALWMALWWLTECVPLAVTALIPLIAFPLSGIATAKETAPRYMTSIMFLFVGGFLIAQALERTGLHKRLALVVLSRFHQSPFQILAGFAFTAAFLSMWISNTATTMLMVTIAIAVLSRLDDLFSSTQMNLFATVLLLTIAYSANIGGMGTPVGTVPNLVFLENVRTSAPELVPSFVQWMMVGVPMVIIGLMVVLFMMGRKVRTLHWQAGSVDHLHDELRSLGPLQRDEKFVGWVLGLTALAWMTRQGIKGDDFSIPGWSSLLPYPGVDDGTVAIFSALLLFLIPIRHGQPVLGKDAIGKLPWDILVLLGGGFALAMGMQGSGLSLWIGEQLSFLSVVPLPLMLLGIAMVIIFLTEITSNTATTQVMLPVLAGVALATDQDLIALLLTTTLAASCAFMLPVATPPNAIVFGSQRIQIKEMIKAGIRLNLIMLVVIVSVVWFLRPLLP